MGSTSATVQKKKSSVWETDSPCPQTLDIANMK